MQNGILNACPVKMKPIKGDGFMVFSFVATSHEPYSCVMPRKLLTIFLTSYLFIGGLLPLSNIGELAKMPNMWRHYRFHVQEIDDSVSFRQFWIDHYQKLNHHHQDQSRHHQLPFQSASQTGIQFLPVTDTPDLAFHTETITVPLPSDEQIAIPQFVNRLFKPPRA